MHPSSRLSLPRALLLVALASTLLAPHALPQEPETGNTGLPPAPPPSGIRPSSRPAPAPPPQPVQAEPTAAQPPRRAATDAFDRSFVLEVRDAPREDADAALRAAVAEVREIEVLVDLAGDPAGEGVAALNAAAGGDPLSVDPRLADLLERTASFCQWSRQAFGPLGGRLNELWGLHERAPARPVGEPLQQALRSAGCGLLQVDAAAATARLASGSRIDLYGFAIGFAVDRAIAVLRDHGVENAYVEIGQVRSAFGPGPGEEGRGWPALLPVFPGLDGPLDRVWLLDESLAVASAVHRPLILAGDRYAPYVDHRTGLPPEGVVGVVAASELAVDAEALAATMLIIGNREGVSRAGGLRPRPALLWLLGSGEGAPVMSQVNWARLSLQ
ncbi:MAG TPA: FAD:protein FMN transferase [Thermoanaerobaculia bacterium]|nr:FAD:protein FMN transferase [Thermoanaerobaculia bacterium]